MLNNDIQLAGVIALEKARGDGLKFIQSQKRLRDEQLERHRALRHYTKLPDNYYKQMREKNKKLNKARTLAGVRVPSSMTKRSFGVMTGDWKRRGFHSRAEAAKTQRTEQAKLLVNARRRMRNRTNTFPRWELSNINRAEADLSDYTNVARPQLQRNLNTKNKMPFGSDMELRQYTAPRRIRKGTYTTDAYTSVSRLPSFGRKQYLQKLRRLGPSTRFDYGITSMDANQRKMRNNTEWSRSKLKSGKPGYMSLSELLETA